MSRVLKGLKLSVSVRITFLTCAALLLAGCASSPPNHVDNICHIFDEKDGWYEDAKRSQKRWGSPIPVMMAILHQESRFRAKAKPPRTKILGFIPGPRKSSAYGYAQVKDETWKEYKQDGGSWGADRDDFEDAIDFVGWYNRKTHQRNKVALNDTYHLYLAYHEGRGGFARRTFKSKPWLMKVAKKVSARARTYQRQLKGCEERLNSSWWWPF